MRWSSTWNLFLFYIFIFFSSCYSTSLIQLFSLVLNRQNHHSGLKWRIYSLNLPGRIHHQHRLAGPKATSGRVLVFITKSLMHYRNTSVQMSRRNVDLTCPLFSPHRTRTVVDGTPQHPKRLFLPGLVIKPRNHGRQFHWRRLFCRGRLMYWNERTYFR